MRLQDISFNEKLFWEKVDQSNGIDSCWIWKAGRTGQKNKLAESEGKLSQYGTFHIRDSNRKQHQMVAHKVMFLLFNEEIQDGMIVMHSCDTPACVNPFHLSVGTRRENVMDSIAKGRHNWTKRWNKENKA